MEFGPITSCQIDGEKVETETYFLFFDLKITADSDCSHKIKICLLLGRKAMTNLDSVLKSRDITLLTKVHIVILSCSVVSNSLQPHGARQVPLSMGDSRQEYWSQQYDFFQ